MANPSSVGVGDDNSGAVLVSATTAASVDIDIAKLYWVKSNGCTTGGTAITGTIGLSTAVTGAGFDEGKGGLVLTSGQEGYIPPGSGTILYFKSVDAGATISIAPVATVRKW